MNHPSAKAEPPRNSENINSGATAAENTLKDMLRISPSQKPEDKASQSDTDRSSEQFHAIPRDCRSFVNHTDRHTDPARCKFIENQVDNNHGKKRHKETFESNTSSRGPTLHMNQLQNVQRKNDVKVTNRPRSPINQEHYNSSGQRPQEQLEHGLVNILAKSSPIPNSHAQNTDDNNPAIQQSLNKDTLTSKPCTTVTKATKPAPPQLNHQHSTATTNSKTLKPQTQEAQTFKTTGKWIPTAGQYAKKLNQTPPASPNIKTQILTEYRDRDQPFSPPASPRIKTPTLTKSHHRTQHLSPTISPITKAPISTTYRNNTQHISSPESPPKERISKTYHHDMHLFQSRRLPSPPSTREQISGKRKLLIPYDYIPDKAPRHKHHRPKTDREPANKLFETYIGTKSTVPTANSITTEIPNNTFSDFNAGGTQKKTRIQEKHRPSCFEYLRSLTRTKVQKGTREGSVKSLAIPTDRHPCPSPTTVYPLATFPGANQRSVNTTTAIHACPEATTCPPDSSPTNPGEGTLLLVISEPPIDSHDLGRLPQSAAKENKQEMITNELSATRSEETMDNRNRPTGTPHRRNKDHIIASVKGTHNQWKCDSRYNGKPPVTISTSIPPKMIPSGNTHLNGSKPSSE